LDALRLSDDPPHHPRRRVRVAAIVVMLTSIVVFLFADGRDNLRCKDNCYGPPPLSRYGSMTYEPGHPWTRYAGSWQWSGQIGLGYLAVLSAVLALALAATDARNPVRPLVVSVVAMIAWIVWVALSPATS
jgi:hypothetical protein